MRFFNLTVIFFYLLFPLNNWSFFFIFLGNSFYGQLFVWNVKMNLFFFWRGNKRLFFVPNRKSRFEDLIYFPTFFTHIIMWWLGKELSGISSTLQIPMSFHLFIKQTDNCFEHSPNCPCWIPFFGMILCNSQTNFSVDLKSAIFIGKNDIRGLEWVFKWK